MLPAEAFVPSLSDAPEYEDGPDALWCDPAAVPTVTFDRTEALDALLDVYLDTRRDGWDGEGAAAVSASALEKACLFVLALPVGIPEPEADASPSGSVLFSWHAAPRRRLTVDLDRRGQLAFAAMLGEDRRRGTTLFIDEVPREVIRLARAVMG